MYTTHINRENLKKTQNLKSIPRATRKTHPVGSKAFTAFDKPRPTTNRFLLSSTLSGSSRWNENPFFFLFHCLCASSSSPTTTTRLTQVHFRSGFPHSLSVGRFVSVFDGDWWRWDGEDSHNIAHISFALLCKCIYNNAINFGVRLAKRGRNFAFSIEGELFVVFSKIFPFFLIHFFVTINNR